MNYERHIRKLAAHTNLRLQIRKQFRFPSSVAIKKSKYLNSIDIPYYKRFHLHIRK